MQQYIRYLIVRPEEVLDFLPEDGWSAYQMYFGKIISMLSTRYRVFKRNRKCVFCGVEGVYMALEADKHSKPRKRRYHFNLYTITGVLMTQDHIVPKSQGGSDGIENLQCACTKCNKKKGNNGMKRLLEAIELVFGKKLEPKFDPKKDVLLYADEEILLHDIPGRIESMLRLAFSIGTEIDEWPGDELPEHLAIKQMIGHALLRNSFEQLSIICPQALKGPIGVRSRNNRLVLIKRPFDLAEELQQFVAMHEHIHLHCDFFKVNSN